jgi:hypothetical protein
LPYGRVDSVTTVLLSPSSVGHNLKKGVSNVVEVEAS